ncbi:dihydrodipicolinate synthase family protein [Cohnella herbarum]|uniref:Dihydrodipicolinate synthase family protein n=1 Tax=Cohnella herbarum TaxID=2728023 RepID=A0A7Z2VF52_9BACL|nr:dihydrodipicolinate synthase family protein [Cohnella herbarum]QJD81977.1 dihydrodipicolinate synthase family protein [Cohnella herbarum]
MKHLYGVTTAMVTPFDSEGKVDTHKVERLTEFLITKGVNCLYPLGTTGEMLRVSVEERKRVAEAVVRTANGRVTVFIHVGAMNATETVELAKHAHEIGADGIGAVTPVFFGANDRELIHYYKTLSDSVPSDFPIYLYSIPQCASNDLKPEVARQIAKECGNVIGIKYSYPDYLRINDYLTINEEKFSVLPGADRLFLPALAMGCDGVVSGISGVYPEPFVAVYKAFIDGDLTKARRLQRLAIRFCEALKNGSNMAYFKEALKFRGVDAGHMKNPQLDLISEDAAALRDSLQELEQQLDQALQSS